MKKRIIILTTILLVVLICFFSVGYAFLNQTLILEGVARIPGEIVQRDFLTDVTYTVFSENPYKIEATITITNISDHDCMAWDAYIDMPRNFEMENVNGADFISATGNTYLFDNPQGYNDYIARGESITFKIQYTTTDPLYELGNILITGTNSTGEDIGGGDDPVNPGNPCNGAYISDNNIMSEYNEDLDASYTVTNSWVELGANVKNIKLSVENKGETNTIWVAIFKIGKNNSVKCYEGLCNQNDDYFVVVPPSYGSTLPSGETVSFDYHISMFDDSDIDLVYVGKSASNYLYTCQPGYEGPGNEEPGTGGGGNEEPTEDPLGDDILESETMNNITASYTFGNNWGSGTPGINVYEISLTISNNTDHVLNNYEVKFKTSQEVNASGCWNGTCSKEGTVLTISNNEPIQVGGSITHTYQIQMTNNDQLNLYYVGEK